MAAAAAVEARDDERSLARAVPGRRRESGRRVEEANPSFVLEGSFDFIFGNFTQTKSRSARA
jgi:hypothetical protein